MATFGFGGSPFGGGGSGFGQSVTAGGGGMFGSSFGMTPGASGLGAAAGSPFGAGAGTNLFGTPGQVAPASKTSPFGVPAVGVSSAAGIFGSQVGALQGGLFGSGGQTAVGLFGAVQSSSSLFGVQSSANLFGAQSSSNLFGSPPSQGPFGAQQSSSFFGGQTTTSLFGAASSQGLFGAAQTTGTSQSPGLFGAPQPTSLFGTPQSGGLFGATLGTGLFGSPQPTTNLFGSTPQQSNPHGSSQPGLFGAQPSPSSGFGGQLNLFGGGGAGSLGVQSSVGLFGGQTGTSLFGGQQSFGAPGASGSAFGGSSLFGAPSAQTQGGAFGLGGQQFGLPSTAQPQGQPLPPSLLSIIEAFNPSSPYYLFRHMLYNVVEPNALSNYQRPSNIDERLWLQAQQNNPDPTRLIPIQVSGFDDLAARISQQETRISQHLGALSTIESTLGKLEEDLKLVAGVKISEYRRRQQELSRRLLGLHLRLDRAAASGRNLTSEELMAKSRIETLVASVSGPDGLRERLLDLSDSVESKLVERRLSSNVQVEVVDARSATALKTHLSEQLRGISHLVNELNASERDMRIIGDHLEVW
eukprot:CAMPEP_0184689814 /NCGR_PEP_ID=MMETSP0312-20130426/30862_1 /TAXON_ID=31354 /ORGANISM="Compsopogon coeruleus, Strain SAG 36.94" /LENGTH=581 /DNA_ID=CAMNT_0027147209 /DNA_START=315 /DNA_END=2057 /DNA_ORIENTATION=+